jgi:hypothetical protein
MTGSQLPQIPFYRGHFKDTLGLLSADKYVFLRGSDIKKKKKREQSSAGIFKQSMGARNRVGIELSYRPARLHSLAELVLWKPFLGSLKV